MKLGLQIPNFTWPGGPATLGADLAAIARAADEAGFEYLGVMDHFFQIPPVGPADHDMLEAYTALGFLAAHTERVKLLTLVTGVHYRQPGLLAKTVTTLDVLSGGRGVLGIGAGWYEEESRGLGLPFPPLKDRFEILEETLRFVRQMWSDDESAFESKHIHAERLLNSPQPLANPHPPILVGGEGEKKTLRLVAQYADACNLMASDELPRKLDVLRAHCEAVGRDFKEITVTVTDALDVGKNGENLDEFKARLRKYAGLGVDATIVGSLDGPDLDVIKLVGEKVIPEAAAY
ncbi:LLM class F420-dependent oxidoreductase [Streptomyces sp. NPDC090499]|uniref:LLM class F420-dependent oxidoreductase n=1 Tax=Streptomyces sp. NPDC090499 TaxID=3365965 RepID=UPI00382E810F